MNKKHDAVPAGGPPRTMYRFFPPLTPAEYESLKRTIAERGVDVPTIWDQEGYLLDGEHRERACGELGTSCPREVRAFESGAEKLEFVLRVNCKRRQLNRKQKRDLIGSYLKVDAAISDNTLADLIGGVSKNTVEDVRSHLESTRQIDKLTEFRGKDGKVRPRSYRIVANTEREFGRAKVAIRQLPDSCDGKILDLTTASRRARRNLKREKSKGVVVEPTPDEDIRLYHCRFQECQERAGIRNGSARLVLTDIPYGKHFLPQIDELGAFSAGILEDGGLFAAHLGVAYLDKKIEALSRHLTYQWTISSFWVGDSNVFYPLNVVNRWKPIVLFSKGEPHPLERWPDLIQIHSKEKHAHEWQQPLFEAHTLLRYFSKPGDLVVDPCGGGFTNAVACRQAGRRFIGCDCDEQCVLQGQKRLAEASSHVFDVEFAERRHLVRADNPTEAAMRVAERYLSHQDGRYSPAIVVWDGKNELYFGTEALFEELGYGLAS